MAQFLHGRTLAVGQSVRLPNHLVKELLGLGGGVGRVSRCELTLTGTRAVDGLHCAVFSTRIDAQSTPKGDPNMQITGQLVLEIDTCRALSAKLSGPVSLSDSGEPPGIGGTTVSGRGTVDVAMQTRYTARGSDGPLKKPSPSRFR